MSIQDFMTNKKERISPEQFMQNRGEVTNEVQTKPKSRIQELMSSEPSASTGVDGSGGVQVLDGAQKERNASAASISLEAKGVPQGNFLERFRGNLVESPKAFGRGLVETHDVLFGGAKKVGEGIATGLVETGVKIPGTDIGFGGQRQEAEDQGIQIDRSDDPTFGEVAGGSAEVGLDIATGGVGGKLISQAGKAVANAVGEKPAQVFIKELGRKLSTMPQLVQNVSLGAGYGASGSLQTGDENLDEIILDTLIGAGLGGSLSLFGKFAGKTRNAKLPGVKGDVEVPDIEVKLTPDEIDLGITEADKAMAQGKKEIITKYVDEAIDTWTNPEARGVYGLGIDRVEDVMASVEKQLNDTGSELGKMREGFIYKKATPEQAVQIETKFNNGLKAIGFEVVDGELKQIKGRGVKLSPSEERIVLDLYSQIQEIKTDPNLQRILDARTNLDADLNFEKRAGSGDRIDRLSKNLRFELKTVLDDAFPQQRAVMDEYINVLGALNEYKKASANGKNIEYLLDRAFGTRGEKARNAFKSIEKITGENLMDDAMAIRLAGNVVNPNQTSRLKQAIEGAGLNILQFANPKIALFKALKEGGEAVIDYSKKKKGIDPRKIEAQRKAEILRNLGTSKPSPVSLPPTTPIKSGSSATTGSKSSPEQQILEESVPSKPKQNQSSPNIIPEETPKASSTKSTQSGKIGEMDLIEEAKKK